MSDCIENIEDRLDSFDPSERRGALEELAYMAGKGDIELPEPGKEVNIHCHTFFSYNSYGFSPSKFAWLARKRGLAVAGVVEFDVLDSLEEFYGACGILGLKGTVGMETRVYVPQFSDREITSPGEPGISYHMGVGFTSDHIGGAPQKFQKNLRETVQERNRSLMERVNAHLDPVTLEYVKDVLSLTPSGNATERHMCLAYARKAQDVFPEGNDLAAFWAERLGTDPGKLGLPEGRELQNMIRKKTMKQGGVGYVQPDRGSFPEMKDMNDFVLECGAIPTHTWLDGSSEGEQAIEELLDVSMSAGAEAINIIPDRNYTAGLGGGDAKLRELYRVVELSRERDLVIVMGTEMNSPGQKFVDDFGSREISPLAEVFLDGAHIVYAHSAMQRRCGLGCTSKWSRRVFGSVGERNEFFRNLGENLSPGHEDSLEALNEQMSPEQVNQLVLDSSR